MLPKNKPIITDAEIKQLAMFLGNYLNKEQCAVKTDEAKQLMNKEVENNNAKSENDKSYITSMVTYSTVPMLIIRDSGNKALVEIEYAYLHQDLKGKKKVRLKGINAHKILSMKNKSEHPVKESADVMEKFTNVLYEACNAGKITLEDREKFLQEAKDLMSSDPELMTEKLAVFTEKKTEAEYRLEKFKKENNFVPDKTRGGNDKNHGTITTKDGDKIKVDLNYKSKTMKCHSGTVDMDQQELPRAMTGSLNTNDSEVHIDKPWLRIKSKKGRQALFDHEVGHLKLHNVGYLDDPNNKLFQRDTVNKNTLLEIFKDMVRPLCPNIDDTSDPFVKEVIDEYKDLVESIANQWKDQNSEQRQKSLLYGMNKSKSIARKKFRNSAKKYTSKVARNPHNNVSELEADAYSANKNGSKAVNKGLKQYTRQYRKHAKNVDEELQPYIKKALSDTEVENQIRKKALHDEKLRKYAKKAFK